MNGSGKNALLGSVFAIIAACAMGLSPSASASPQGGGDSRALAQRVLAVHNGERARVGVPALRWNDSLAAKAASWGRSLASRGVLEHSSQAMREGHGENLWMGSAGQWPVEAMVGMFIAEKRDFRHAAFPNVSRSGNWANVGHYTQLVWRDTQEVGCAVVTARGNDFLVCRYWPAGNVYGQRPY